MRSLYIFLGACLVALATLWYLGFRNVAAAGERWKNHLNTGMLKENITVVTAFLDLGTIMKGSQTDTRSAATYMEWMFAFSYIQCPLVVYVDSKKAMETVQWRRRQLMDRTKIIMVEKFDLYSFREFYNATNSIFRKPGYPKFFPNTVNPEYSCAMHAKYDFMEMTTRENPFNSRYFLWMDAGLFRDLETESSFGLKIPREFNENRVAYGEVFAYEAPVPLPRLVSENKVWVCGCIFFGERNVIRTWVGKYRTAVRNMLERGWMSTDQQVLYYLAQPHMRSKDFIQTFTNGRTLHSWRHLGYYTKDLWEASHGNGRLVHQ